jgi:hypothetical protein
MSFLPEPTAAPAAGVSTIDGAPAFRYARVEEPGDLPPADPRGVDVAILDLNCGWPNLGHDSIVEAVREVAGRLAPELDDAGLYLRAISFAVRDHDALPEPPVTGRFGVYVGTGGPGHIDPHQNDGVSPCSQGIREDPAWERTAFDLFDAIRDDPGAALLAVCHSFGVLCRWAGVARPALRGADKGGKRSGVFEDVLSDEALAHPWFSRFAARLADGHHLRVLENRLFDLLPLPGPRPAGFVPIGYEGGEGHGGDGFGITMIELARDAGGVMPRIFGVNSHPEIVDRVHQHRLLEEKLARGEVSRAWYEERLEALTRVHPAEDSDRRLRLTSDYTFLLPLRFHLERQVRRRAEALGGAGFDEPDSP